MKFLARVCELGPPGEQRESGSRFLKTGDFPSGQVENGWRQTQAGIEAARTYGDRELAEHVPENKKKKPGPCSAPRPRHSQHSGVSPTVVRGPPPPTPPKEFTGKHASPMLI